MRAGSTPEPSTTAFTTAPARSSTGRSLSDPPNVPTGVRSGWTRAALLSSAMSASLRASDQLSRDDVALDLVGPLADDHQRGVSEVALHVVLLGVAVAAVDTDRVEGDLHGCLRGEELGHPGFHVGALATVELLSRVSGEQPCGLKLGDTVGKVVADRLVLP